MEQPDKLKARVSTPADQPQLETSAVVPVDEQGSEATEAHGDDERLLERLATLAQAVGTAPDLDTVFRALREFVVTSTLSNALFASLYDPVAQLRTCVYAWSEGEEIDIATLPPLPMSDSPHSRAVATGQIIVTDDLQAALVGQPRIDVQFDVDPRQPRASMAVPMAVMGRVIGGFEVQSPQLAAYRQEHVVAIRMAANLAAIAVENVRLLERERELRQAAEASERRVRFLADASASLATSLDYRTTLTNVANLAVPVFADWCFVDWVQENGSFQRLVVAQNDPAKQQLARDLQRHYPPLPDTAHAISKVARTGRPELETEVGDEMLVAEARDARHLAMLRAVGIRSFICVPLSARGRSFGAVTFIVGESGRRFTLDDLHLAEDLARRSALAVDNARLFEDESRARSEAEEASLMVSRLLTISDTALAHPALDDLLHEFLGRVQELLAGDTVAILLLEPDGRHLAVRAALGLEQDIEQDIRIPVGQGIAGRIAATRAPLIVDDLATVEVASPALREKGVRSLIGAPLMVEGRVIGVVHVGTLRTRQFTADDRRLLQFVADRAALAIDRARLYQTAQEGVRMRDEFLSIAAHELRTPITSLLGYAEILQQRARRNGITSERDQRPVRVIVDQAGRLARLINMLLDLSRMGTGHFAIECRQMDLVAFARRLVEETRVTLMRHTLTIECLTEALPVDGDELRLEQVFQNLLQNAVKYSPDGGHITLRVERGENQAVVSVSDQGLGIPEAAQARLFQRFFRAGNASDSQISGFGIGLFVVQEIVSRHNGVVEVASVEGQGSTFTVRLPLTQP